MRVRGKPVSCCFTGHRPAKLPWGTDESDERCLRLKARLREVIARAVEDGYTHFICGMAEGCDLYCAEAVLALRERHSEVTLEAAIPCPTQADGWSEAQRERYRRILEQCDYAVHDGLPGGTRYTIEYALRRGVNIIDVPIEE